MTKIKDCKGECDELHSLTCYRDEGLLLKLLHQGGLVVSSAQRRLVHWKSALAQPIIGYSHPLVGRHLQAQLGRRLAGKNEATLAAAMLVG